jgi:hypothetical protein
VRYVCALSFTHKTAIAKQAWSSKLTVGDETDWNANVAGGFGLHAPGDEYYHGAGPAGDTLTETWYWNFFIAEAAINCFAYCWVHPNLRVVTGGLMIYQGWKPNHLACEVFEMRDYLSMQVVGDGSVIALPSGFRVEVIEPLEHVRLNFADSRRETALTVDLRAAGAPVMRANNKHFEQVMHATGTLLLRGTRHAVDCYPVRDRSWGELRPEDHAAVPPYTWLTGTFGPDMAFNLGMHDDPASDPEWIGIMDAPKHIFKDGWVVVNGEQRRVVRATKATRRDRPGLRPVSHTIEFEDSAGEVYRMQGEVIAQTNWAGWSNMNTHLGLVRWNWSGRTGFGETQDVQWNDYVYLMTKHAEDGPCR